MFSKISPGIVSFKIFQLSFQFSSLKASFLLKLFLSNVISGYRTIQLHVYSRWERGSRVGNLKVYLIYRRNFLSFYSLYKPLVNNILYHVNLITVCEDNSWQRRGASNYFLTNRILSNFRPVELRYWDTFFSRSDANWRKPRKISKKN